MSQSTEEKMAKDELAKAFSEDGKIEEIANLNGSGGENESKAVSKVEEKLKKKKLSRKTKIWIVVGLSWVTLVGLAIGLAFVFRSVEEITLTEEAFKWDGVYDGEVELVDIDYYSLVDMNAITFEYPYGNVLEDGETVNPNYNLKLSRVPQIKGLKNLEVQERINQKIIDIANNMVASEEYSMRMHIGANINNVLSVLFAGRENSNNYNYNYVGLNVDLVTGEEIGFDDVFTKNANIQAILYKRFYNTLSTEYSFDLMETERAISEIENGNCIYYCNQSKSLDEYLSEKSAAEERLANIEEITMNKVKEYLAGERKFYLESAGPVFIYDGDDSVTDYFTGDDIQNMAYLEKYRTAESIFADDSVGIKNYFLSSVIIGDYKAAWAKENDNYFVSFLDNRSDGNTNIEKTMFYADSFLDDILSERDTSKYVYVDMYGGVWRVNDNLYSVDFSAHTYETNRDYYDTVFRKAIFDGKSLESSYPSYYQPPKTKSYDENMVKSEHILRYAYIDEDNNIYDTAESIFVPDVRAKYDAYRYSSLSSGFSEKAEASEKDYRELLIDYYYENVGEWSNGYYSKIDFSDEEKAGHEFEFELNGLGISINLKNNDRSESIEIDKIPNVFLKEPFRHD